MKKYIAIGPETDNSLACIFFTDTENEPYLSVFIKLVDPFNHTNAGVSRSLSSIEICPYKSNSEVPGSFQNGFEVHAMEKRTKETT